MTAWGRVAACALAAVLVAACTNGADDAGDRVARRGGPADATAGTPSPSALPSPAPPARRPLALTVAGGGPPGSLIGLDRTRVVVEYPVAGDATGLLALLDTDADAVGPLRSATPSDAALARAFGADLVTTGTTGAVVEELGSADLAVVEEHTVPGGLLRDPARRAPFNLYGVPERIRAALGDRAPVTPWRPGDAVTGAVSPRAEVAVAAAETVSVIWTWDTTVRRWLRTASGQLEQSATGERVHARVVVVLEAPAHDRPAVVADLIGAGDAVVLRDGVIVAGRWRRDDHATLPTIIGLDRDALAAGTVWLHICAAPCVTPSPA